MNKYTAQTLARTLMDRHGLNHVPFEFSRAKKALGQTKFMRNNFTGQSQVMGIYLSSHWTEILPENEIRDVILHEIAHALAGHAAGHGPQWKAIARSIGAKPERCAAPSAELEARWVGRCRNGHESKQHRAPGRVKACGKCSSVWKAENLIVWTKDGQKIAPSNISTGYAREYAMMVAMNRL